MSRFPESALTLGGCCAHPPANNANNRINSATSAVRRASHRQVRMSVLLLGFTLTPGPFSLHRSFLARERGVRVQTGTADCMPDCLYLDQDSHRREPGRFHVLLIVVSDGLLNREDR